MNILKKISAPLLALAVLIIVSPVQSSETTIPDIQQLLKQTNENKKQIENLTFVRNVNAPKALRDIADKMRNNGSHNIANLLEGKADVNARDKYGFTPLMHATSNKEITSLLLDNGADVNLTSNAGYTALMAAANGCDTDAVEILISRGAQLDIQREDGSTALHDAVTENCIGSAEALLKAGAKPDLTVAKSAFDLLPIKEKFGLLVMSARDAGYTGDSQMVPITELLDLRKNKIESLENEIHWLTPLDIAERDKNTKMVELFKTYDKEWYEFWK